MYLNTLKVVPGARSTKRRVGRGIGSGWGKTCARGHKGQRSRSGGFHKVGFEGGQTPMQRRLPKSGFNSWKKRYRAEVRLDQLHHCQDAKVSMASLRQAGLIAEHIKFVKIIGSGKIDVAVSVTDVPLTAGALEAIKAAGGQVAV